MHCSSGPRCAIACAMLSTTAGSTTPSSESIPAKPHMATVFGLALATRCERLGGRALATDGAVISPHIAPVAVATAVVDADVVEIAVHRLHGLGAFEIEDHIRGTDHAGVAR